MRVHVAIAHTPELLELLRRAGADTLTAELPENLGDYLLPEEVAEETEVLFCELPPRNIREMKKLRLIQISSTGYSQLFDLGLVERGVRACNGRGEFDCPIAEWTAAMLVNLNRDLRSMLRNAEAGIWDRDARFQTELRGKTLGFFGYGSLARESARLAKAMGMRIYAYDRERADFTGRHYYSVPGTGDPRCELPDRFFLPGEERAFLETLDFLAVAVPLTKRTEGIITEEMLRMLPRGACLLNFARGPLIEEEGLLAVLRDGHLGGAALDAHYCYPLPADHPLWRFPNVILTPHISGSTLSTNFLPRIYDICAQNLRRYAAGEPLLNELTPAQLAGE